MIFRSLGQGSIGIEIRESDGDVRNIINRFNHRETSLCVRAERAFLKRLEGGCQVPIAALGTINRSAIKLDGLVASVDGKIVHRDSEIDEDDRVEELGIRLLGEISKRGGGQKLKKGY